MKFFDAHTHVQFAAFKDDYRDVIRRALDAGVCLINVGTQRNTSRRAVEIAYEYENGSVFATVGLHPIHTESSYHDEQELEFLPQINADSTQINADKEIGASTPPPTNNPTLSNSRELENEGMRGFTSRGEEFDYEYYKKLASDPIVIAIGECGLDYYRIENNELGIKEKQKKAFVQQIELAREIKKPLMIHCRNAFADLVDLLKANSSKLKADAPGIIHFFSGAKDDAKKLLDLGFSFTFGGVVTFTRDYDEVIKMIPLDRILSETDAPYVTPAPYRGKRNEPAHVAGVVKKLAEMKQVDIEIMANQIIKNAQKVFGLGQS